VTYIGKEPKEVTYIGKVIREVMESRWVWWRAGARNDGDRCSP
jgi:hypothetical protein